MLRLALEVLSSRWLDQRAVLDSHARISEFIHILRSFALVVLALSVCALPGSNVKLPSSTHELVAWLVCVAFICWLVSRIIDRKFPQLHERAVWLIAVLISLCGWLLAYFPRAIVERASGAILDLDQNPWAAFGTMDQAASLQAMSSITLALMILLMVLDFAAERSGRFVLALAVMTAGFITAVAGLCINTSADLASLWHMRYVTDSVFGLFWYHGNAAAFLNLAWPAGVWLCLILLHKESLTLLQQVMLAVLMVAVMLQIVAVFVNVSKMGHLLLVGELLLLVGGGLLIWRPRLSELPLGWRRLLLLGCIGIVLLLAGAWLSGASVGMGRWNVLAARHFDDPARRHAAVMAVQIGLDHGWLGTGPGTFEWVSAHYSTLDPVLQDGRWRHAHNDYAEFFAEWGWLGVVLFTLVLALLGRRVWRALRIALSKRVRHAMSFQRRIGLVAFGTAIVSVLLHAVVDFPLQIDAIRQLSAVIMGLVLALASSATRSVSKR